MNYVLVKPIPLISLIADRQFDFVKTKHKASSRNRNVELHGYRGVLDIDAKQNVTGFSTSKPARFVRYFVRGLGAQVVPRDSILYHSKSYYEKLLNFQEQNDCKLYPSTMRAEDTNDDIITEKAKSLFLDIKWITLGKARFWLYVPNDLVGYEKDMAEMIVEDMVPIMDFDVACEKMSQAVLSNFLCSA